MNTNYDIAIIGGGHNGLTAAAYLAKAGRRVIVLEKKQITGGVALTEELFPGFSVSSLIDGDHCFSDKVINDLKLDKFGLEIIDRNLSESPIIFSPQKDGKHLVIHHDIEKTCQEISRFLVNDAKAYPEFVKLMRQYARIITTINQMVLPDLPEPGLMDIFSALKLLKPVRALGWRNTPHFMRVLPLSVADLLGEWFESDVVKGAIALSGLNHISLGPQESGTAFAFLQNFSNSDINLFCSSAQYRGGTGALSWALEKAAKHFGASILTNAQVCKIKIENDRAKGVELDDGIFIPAGKVVSSLDMQTTFSGLIKENSLSQTDLQKVNNITYNGTTARVHFALDRLPEFIGLSDNDVHLLKGHIQLSPGLAEIQKAYDPVKYGRIPAKPYLDIRIPSLTDSSVAPEGRYLMSVTVKYIPYHLRDGNWEDLKDGLVKKVVETIGEYAPDFSMCIQQSCAITPLDMEKTYDLPQGSITHGDITLDQMLWMRPIPGYAKYNSPVKRLYLCGAASHPGAGVTGLNGYNAARRILKDKSR